MASIRELEPTESDVLDTAAAGGLVIRGGALRVLAYATTSLLALGAVVVVTRYLEPARFGQYQTIVSLMIVVGAVSDLGMATLGTREFSQRSGGDRRSYMRILLGLRLLLTLLGAIGAIIFALVAGYSSDLLLGTAFAAISLVLMVVQTTLSIPLGVELRLGTLAAMDIARQALTTALIIGVVFAGGGVAELLGATIPVQLLLVVWAYVLVRGKIPLRPSFSITAWRGLLGATIGFALAMASGAIYQNLAQILTSLVAGETQTGIFSAAFRVYMIIGSVPFILVAGSFPVLARAARDDHQRLHYALRRLTQATLLVGGACALFVYFGATPIIEVIGGSGFAASAAVLKILAVAMLVGFALISWGFGLLSLHLHRALVVANVAALLIMGALVLSLSPSELGARGTAIAVLVGEVCLAFGYAVGLRAGAGSARLLAPETLRALVALAGAAALGAVIPLESPVAKVIAALMAYAFLLIVLRAVPREATEMLPPGLRSRVPGWMLAD
jgi:O-antigen/teichoic acid export membrane protein